jgi:lipopolysaccharide/colanic/teichoic acid biosynthesis glycosyltransferase
MVRLESRQCVRRSPAPKSPDDVRRVAFVRPAGESSALMGAAYRALDIALSALVAVPLSPLLAGVAVAIRIESSGPVIVGQRRLGLDFEPFTMHLFRTTRRGPGDEIVETRVGRVLRAAHADGLPQLWDVLWGHMSLVGPRPARPHEVEVYPAGVLFPHWFLRFAVKPGITGLAQLHAPGATFEDEVRLDVDYVCRRSLPLNVEILVRTLFSLPRTGGDA